MDRILLRRGTNSERELMIPASSEPIWITDTKRLYVGDGSTSGGILVSSATKEVAKTSDYTIVTTDSHVDFTNQASTGVIILTLPTAVTGLRFTFAVTTAFELRVLGTIRSGGSTISNINSNSIGSYLCIEVRNNTYFVTSKLGTWTES